MVGWMDWQLKGRKLVRKMKGMKGGGRVRLGEWVIAMAERWGVKVAWAYSPIGHRHQLLGGLSIFHVVR